mmetsp:Transcript_324/g.934  ORF Transcript_324/g.934 Transcript_324/m.934 type:complete len:357 (-) Transcript_324:349-1419(-)
MEGGPADPLYVPAAQPDIIRAAQKDQLYIDVVTEAFQEAARGIFGPRRALLASRGTQLVSTLLYHALTTGAGSRTLGEEYCDLLQVTGSLPVEPGAARRATLVLLQTVLPYCLQRLSLPHGGPGDGAEEIWPPRDVWREGSAAAPPPLPHERLWNKVRLASRKVLNFCSVYSGELARLHLALFYIYGVYYQWPKRLTGIKYAFIGKTFEQRANYRVLGTLLFMQLAVTAGFGAVDVLSQQLQPHQGQAAPEGSDDKPGHAVLLQEELPAGTAQQSTAQLQGVGSSASAESPPGGEVSSRRKCPLCLSVRVVTTSTPCGHLFCWQCIAEWCNQKPECPLCRSAFTTSQLVCVYHTDM